MNRALTAIFNRLTIGVPYLWLIIFFLIPFAIVFKISLSETAIQMPPYNPVFDGTDTAEKLKSLTTDNYTFLTEDPLYYRAYISSIITALIATFLTLLIGRARHRRCGQPCSCWSYCRSGPRS
jgi:putrescine transport system permease protein